MPRFLDHYFKDETFYMPIDLDLCSITEQGELEIGIPLKYLPELVEHDVIRLSLKGKTFKTIKEAYEFHDSLSEADEEDEKDSKLKTIVKDPDTGTERRFEVAAGNAKIGGDTVLLNMSTAGNCMSAILGTCKLGPNGQCYALRFEKQWKGAEEKNKRHEEQWACLTARGIAQGIAQISEVMPSIKYVRINEAGEIRNLPSNPELLAKVSDEKKAELAEVDDVEKLKAVGAELIKMGSNLTLYTYTHRIDLTIGDLGPNICINGSGHMIDNNFVPVTLDEFHKVMDLIETKQLKEFNGEPVKIGVHCMGDCRKCSYCKKKEKKHIFLPIHGSGTPYQKQLENILTAVTDNPEFANIYSSQGNPIEKAKMAIQLVPEDMKKIFSRLVPLPVDRIDLFVKIIKSRGNTELLIKAIESFVASSKEGNIDIPISQEDSTEGLAKSVDSLVGKFASSIEGALASGKQASLNKWTALSNSLKNAIEMAQRGEKPKVTGALAKQHAGTFGRIKKDLAKGALPQK